ncbi:MAG: hypothetical protein HRT44_13300, partial [Bdellovibrionales bacterium]|nr:hypothetical protein [Bdellovibrionales bacterium]
MDNENSTPQIWGKDLEVFFITFDEPLKDQYWEMISETVPHARRVDSV